MLAINALCKLPKGDLLVPDADEMIERFLNQEQDMSAKRNALIMLTEHSQVTHDTHVLVLHTTAGSLVIPQYLGICIHDFW